jgi:hypothetical protein
MCTVRNEKGSALVTALFFITGLTVAAAIIAMVATSEKRTVQNEYTHSRSFYSSDAGTEAAINWIRERPIDSAPFPAGNLPGSVTQVNNYIDLHGGPNDLSNKYKYGVDLNTLSPATGYDLSYRNFNFTIDADGAAAGGSNAAVQSQVTRLFRIAY